MMGVRWLGRISHDEALALQEELLEKIRRAEQPDTLLLLEHEPVYTIGRTRDQRSLGAINHLPHPAREINRGGQATYHGPGQLVGYPLCDLNHLGRDLHAHLRWLEDLLAQLCWRHGVKTTPREGLTGTWVGTRKMASIGVGVRHWVSMHGFALNVTPECLGGFAAITPCGLTGVEMTCLADESGEELTVENIAREFGDLFQLDHARRLGEARGKFWSAKN
jgi:lipoyl(octanoyl) transferase